MYTGWKIKVSNARTNTVWSQTPRKKTIGSHNHKNKIFRKFKINLNRVESLTLFCIHVSMYTYMYTIVPSRPLLAFNRNYHGPLKAKTTYSNYHGIDGKSWFKKQGPLWALAVMIRVNPNSSGVYLFFNPPGGCA